MSNTPEKPSQTFELSCKPGIKRDGTVLDGNFYADGEWVRFRNGRPKKMGGYREIVSGLNGPVRGTYVYSNHPDQLVYTFSGSGIEVTPVDPNGVGGATYDRTPASGFTAQDRYLWTYDVIYDSTGTPAAKIVAHAAEILAGGACDKTTNLPVFYGGVTAAAALAQFATPQSVSGGVTVLGPYTFLYGNNGLIKNSIANDPAVYVGGDSNSANPVGTKVVKGLPLRGASQSPAGLFWSLDSLVRVSYVGGAAIWSYDIVTSNTSIMGPTTVIEVDGIYYWIGADRFLMYNGVVKELPNPMNQDFFFDNLNLPQRQKVWATALPRWGEIWWFFPKGSATECNHAIVYNYREGTWYDTPIKRSAGYAPRVLQFPVWADNVAASDDTYNIYRHETGVDKVQGESQTAITSWFETSDIGLAAGGPIEGSPVGKDQQTILQRLEPDFVQTGDMTVVVATQQYAQAEVSETDPFTFSPTDGKIDIRKQGRLMRLIFESNVQGGDYMMGRVMMGMDPGDIRS